MIAQSINCSLLSDFTLRQTNAMLRIHNGSPLALDFCRVLTGHRSPEQSRPTVSAATSAGSSAAAEGPGTREQSRRFSLQTEANDSTRSTLDDRRLPHRGRPVIMRGRRTPVTQLSPSPLLPPSTQPSLSPPNSPPSSMLSPDPDTGPRPLWPGRPPLFTPRAAASRGTTDICPRRRH